MKIFKFLIFILAISCSKKEKGLIADFYNFENLSVNYNDSVVKIVNLKNTTSKKIKITSLESSCGCTSAFIDGNEVKPDGEKQLKILYIPKKGDDTANFEKFITLRTDYKNQFLNFKIAGNVTK